MSAGASGERLFPFFQWEFVGVLGPPAGRYVLRHHAGEDAHHVLAVAALTGGRRRRLAGSRAKQGASTPELSRTRATLIATAPLDDESARAWLGRAVANEAARADALAMLNGAVAAHRAATADPYVADVSEAQALVVRIGYGRGEQVAEGRWEAAREVDSRPPAPGGGRESDSPRGRGGRRAALRPQERLAAVLSGRDVVLAAEALVLRARLDLDQGREREAAMQAHLALEAAATELEAWRGLPGMPERLADLERRRDAVAGAANAALQGGLEPDARDAVTAAVDRVEAALRARSAAGPT